MTMAVNADTAALSVGHQVTQYANEFVAERVKGRLDQHHQRAESGGKTGFDVDSLGHEASQPDKSAQAATQGTTKPSHPAEGAAKPREQSGGSVRPEGAPVPSNNQQRFEDEKAAMMKKSNDFRQRVRDQQQERKLTVESSEGKITSQKSDVEKKTNDVKDKIRTQNESVEHDNFQQKMKVKDPVGDAAASISEKLKKIKK